MDDPDTSSWPYPFSDRDPQDQQQSETNDELSNYAPEVEMVDAEPLAETDWYDEVCT